MSAFRIPHSVAIGGDPSKGILTGRYARVVSRAPCAGLDPIRVETLHLVAKSNLSGFDKAECGVLDVEAQLAGVKSGRPVCRAAAPIHKRIFNYDGWRVNIYFRR